MATEIKINPEYKDRRVSHNRTCKAIGDHSQKELKQLAIEARKSDNPVLLQCFIDLPELSELLEEKTTAEIAAVKPAPAIQKAAEPVKPELPKP